MSTMMVIPFLLLIVVVALGWPLPLAMGIRRIRRGKGGVALTVVGGVWGAIGLGLIGTVAYAVLIFSRVSREQPKIETFDASRHGGDTGVIQVPYLGCSGLVLSRTGQSGSVIRCETTNGVIVVPAGTLKARSYDLTAQNGTNGEWSAYASYDSGTGSEIVVAAGQTIDLAEGPPFDAVIKVEQQTEGRVSLDLSITGCGGRRFSMYNRRGRDAAPRFEVLNSSGERVWEGKFTYG
jgi:hypothetical protein